MGRLNAQPVRYEERTQERSVPPRTRFARARFPLGLLLASLKSVAAVFRFRSSDQRLFRPTRADRRQLFRRGSNSGWGQSRWDRNLSNRAG
jgi:hypothetical protein